MKNMRKFIKQNIKGFIVGLIVTGVGIVTASTIMPSNSVTYNNSSQNVTNVKEALDVLLEKADNEAPTVSVSVSGKTATFTLKDDLGVIGYQVTTSAAEPTSWIDITSTTSIVKTWTASSAGTYYVHVKDKFGKTSNASFTIATSAFCAYNAGQTWTFDYTGGVQSFTAPCAGTYKLEVWGAQGGNYETAVGGKGGYSYGNKEVTSKSTLYISVGGQNKSYNGAYQYSYGGDGSRCGAGGGGATHISTTNRGALSNYASYKTEILIVAGGGGGAGKLSSLWDGVNHYLTGGVGGGTAGGAGSKVESLNNIVGMIVGGAGTQSGSGIQANYGPYPSVRMPGFGLGGVPNISSIYTGGGGGGGYYGGGAGYQGASGGGGSGYIGGVTGGSMTNGQRSGNGMARITLVSFSG